MTELEHQEENNPKPDQFPYLRIVSTARMSAFAAGIALWIFSFFIPAAGDSNITGNRMLEFFTFNFIVFLGIPSFIIAILLMKRKPAGAYAGIFFDFLWAVSLFFILFQFPTSIQTFISNLPFVIIYIIPVVEGIYLVSVLKKWYSRPKQIEKLSAK